MRQLIVNNYIITTPLFDIVKDLRSVLTNGKLKDIKLHTDDIVVTCPVHSGGFEDVPDCNIYIGNDEDIPYGFARCFACDFKGQFYQFVARCFNSSDDFAKEWLIKNYSTGEQNSISILLDGDIDINDKSQSIILNESILDNYQHWTPYLEKRKLSRDICEKFKVRYDPYNRQVIFPIRDINGNLKMLARRSIDTKFFHMDANQEKEVYGLNVIQKNNVKTCLIVEGLIDCLTGWTYGVPTIATLGTPSDYQINLINKSCLTTIYTMFDNDDAGKRFTEKLKNSLNKRIIVETINIPNGYKDINDLSYEKFKEIYEKAIKN